MFLLKLFRKLVKLVRGGAGPIQIITGALLGMLIGMTPGINLTVVGLALALLILNASFGVAMLGILVGKLLCLVLAPLTFQIGYALIHGTPLGGLIPAVSETPVAAWLDLHYYCLVGGLPIALALGVVLGWLINRALDGLRRGIQASLDRSEKLQRAGQNIFVRILLRLLFGKQKKPLAELLGVRHPVFRKAGVILCLILIIPLAGFQALFADSTARNGVVEGLQMATGAEVNVDRVELSLTEGKLIITGLQVTDPDKPTHNLFQADRLESDVSLTDLLAHRIVVDNMTVDKLLLDVKRDKPGKVFVEPEEIPEPSGSTVDDYFEKGKKVAEYLKKLKRYLDEHKKEQAEEVPNAEDVAEEARRRGYLKMAAGNLLAQRPRVTIRHIEIREVPVAENVVLSLVGKEVSERPDLNEEPMTWEIRRAGEIGGKVKQTGLLTLDFTTLDAMHEIKIDAPNVRLGDMAEFSNKVPLSFSDALVDLVGAGGKFNADTMHLVLPIKLRNVKVSTRKDEPFLGMNPATAKEILDKLTTWDMIIGLDGAIAGPTVSVDDRQLLARLKKAMKEAGQEALASMANDQLQKIAPNYELPKDFGGLDKIGKGDVVGGVSDLLKLEDGKSGIVDGLLKPKDDDKKNTPTTKPAGVGSLLDRL